MSREISGLPVRHESSLRIDDDDHADSSNDDRPPVDSNIADAPWVRSYDNLDILPPQETATTGHGANDSDTHHS